MKKEGNMENSIKSEYYPWIIVIIFSLLGITLPAAVTQFSMTVSDLSMKFGVSEQMILFGDTIRASIIVISMFMSAIIYEKLGYKRTLIAGLTFQIIPQFLIPFAPDVPVFLFLKGLQGFNSIAFPLYISTIVSLVRNDQKGLATSIFNGSFVAGAGVGAWIAGQVIPRFGWQASYFAIGGLSLIFACITIFVSRDASSCSACEERQLTKTVKADGSYKYVVSRITTWIMIIALTASNWISQAVTVDMPVYSAYIGYNFEETGNLMMIISIVTLISSILAGAISDRFAHISKDKLLSRSIILSLGYILAACAAFILPHFAQKNILGLIIFSSAMMFGSSWAGGVFWAIPSEVYSKEHNIAGTGFCSGASNLLNPLSPVVVGIYLGSKGMWEAGWYTCAFIALISLTAVLSLPILYKKEKQNSIAFVKVKKQVTKAGL